MRSGYETIKKRSSTLMSSGKTPRNMEGKKKPATRPKAAPADHPKYSEMVCAAIAVLKGRNGSSRQAIAKYLKAHYKVGKNFNVHVNKALKSGVANGWLIHTKGSGATGSFKLTKKCRTTDATTKKAGLKPRKPAAKKLAPNHVTKKDKTVAKPKERPTKHSRSPFEDSGTLEDEYEDEVDSLEDKQLEVEGERMIQVDRQGNWLKEVIKELPPTFSGKIGEETLTAIKEASKATCLVLRTHNSQERVQYHKRSAQDKTLEEEERLDHDQRAKLAEKGAVASGTGMKLAADGCDPANENGSPHFVVTNNHVIMNDEEARSAVVIFDYYIDGDRKTGTKEYKVRSLFESFPRTTGPGDRVNLDCSVLVIEAEDNDPFLLSRGIRDCEYNSPHECEDKDLLDTYPVLMFSHPRGLAMRVGVGMYPDVAKECISHIKHYLPSCKGSSGASLLVSAEVDFREWVATFLHYRHHRAVTHRAIYLKGVEEYNKEKGYEAIKPKDITEFD